jgi:uncharacterized phage-associated protein
MDTPLPAPGNIFDLAAAILALTGPLPAMQLHRLTYAAQARHLDAAGEPLTDAPFEARYAGPVNAELFEALHGSFTVDRLPAGDPAVFGTEQAASIAGTVDAYGNLSAGELSGILRAGRAYRQAWGGPIPGTPGRIISPAAMHQHGTLAA